MGLCNQFQLVINLMRRLCACDYIVVIFLDPLCHVNNTFCYDNRIRNAIYLTQNRHKDILCLVSFCLYYCFSTLFRFICPHILQGCFHWYGNNCKTSLVTVKFSGIWEKINLGRKMDQANVRRICWNGMFLFARIWNMRIHVVNFKALKQNFRPQLE